MNNDEKILTLLENMDKRLEKLETGQVELRAEMNERFSEMNDRFDSVELSIKEAWKDLEHIEDRVDFHDTAIKSIM